MPTRRKPQGISSRKRRCPDVARPISKVLFGLSRHLEAVELHRFNGNAS